MTVYVDSSVLLRIILDQPGAFLYATKWRLAVTSELLRVEVLRTLDKLRVKGRLTDAALADKLVLFRRLTRAFQELPIQPAILQRASSPFPTSVSTLDAIHLASALLWVEHSGEPLTFLTHDAELALAARASGLDVKTAP